MTKVEKAWCEFVEAVKAEQEETGDKSQEIWEAADEMFSRFPNGLSSWKDE